MKMAAAGCTKSAGDLGQRDRTRPSSVSSQNHVRSLSLEEARCPVCSEILLEPVTMPCGHSVCLHCFRRTVEFSGLCCPSCRLRVSSWARNKQSREKSLVNTELWDRVRQSYPEKCGRRLRQRDRGAPVEDVFCSPTVPFKTGEIHQDNEKQNKKITTAEEMEERVKKKPKHRKGECGLLQESSFGLLSNSENEEPMRMRTRHASAFVHRTRTRLTSGFSRGFHNSVVQRSQSCTDSEEGRRKIRARVHLSLPEKASIVHSFNAGILLSSENSRSFSAPILPLDKKHQWRSILSSPVSSLVPHTKPERSVSPESNDSISEELNHFKPIVCSPCTPPKRLPDGRLMKPTIVKSTPRNLTQSLQKSTSYEASPSILQKWKQVELDRQCVKFASKGTITSPVAEDLGILQSSEEDRGNKSCSCALAEIDLHCTCAGNKHLYEKEKEKSLLHNKRRLIFDHCSKNEDFQSANALHTQTALGFSDIPKLYNACEAHYSPPEQTKFAKPPMMDKRAGITPNQGSKDVQDFRNELTVMNLRNRPTSRRGKKRSQKTKHLEETGIVKIARTESYDCWGKQHGEKNLHVDRTHQEIKDRELALKLQRQFDKECHIIERHKMSSDKYSLRSWVCIDSISNPRRSGRLSRKIKHFNYK
ncbi:E3 ubiquitin-protein ligase RNF169 isoform X2 [Trichomycterus rosablanca]|uniref:E3 ubiquitin-protein ligase RNF169 isoform X2 n=1 Tax=Trichomycterus rosablanca TaxID=2290929 RepID=UPI002F351F7C